MVFGFMLAALVGVTAADALLRLLGHRMTSTQEIALDSRPLAADRFIRQYVNRWIH